MCMAIEKTQTTLKFGGVLLTLKGVDKPFH